MSHAGHVLTFLVRRRGQAAARVNPLDSGLSGLRTPWPAGPAGRHGTGPGAHRVTREAPRPSWANSLIRSRPAPIGPAGGTKARTESAARPGVPRRATGEPCCATG